MQASRVHARYMLGMKVNDIAEMESIKMCIRDSPMRWVGRMNTLTAQIEEILIRELICS